MIVTEKKPIEEVLNSLADEKSVFIVGCQGCPEGAQTGGEEEIADLAKKLGEAGKEVTGSVLIDFLCNKVLVGVRLSRNLESVKKAGGLLVVSCGVGVQAVANIAAKPVYPALNTVSMGGVQGLWPSNERCGECGECVLDMTGGICPVTMCAKSLMNGACGGSNDGKCEVHADKECGWYLIYDRLKSLNRLDNLKKYMAPRSFSKQDFPIDKLGTTLWALEVDEKAAD
jgi:hypothetical protein